VELTNIDNLLTPESTIKPDFRSRIDTPKMILSQDAWENFGLGPFSSENVPYLGRSGMVFAEKVVELAISRLCEQDDLDGIHMYEVAYTNAIAVLVEVEFHDNVNGATWIVNNIEQIGIALAKGVLSSLGISYVHLSPPTSKTFYRVMCGSFAKRENAEKRVEELKKAGFESTIMEV